MLVIFLFTLLTSEKGEYSMGIMVNTQTRGGIGLIITPPHGMANPTILGMAMIVQWH